MSHKYHFLLDRNDHRGAHWFWLSLVISCGWGGAATSSLKHGEMEVVQPPPAQWERKLDGVYENRGVARITKVATHYVLTIYCNGTHSVYIEDNKALCLDAYFEKVVRTRYVYVEKNRFDVQCVKPPCGPVTERRILIQEIKEVPHSRDATTYTGVACAD